MIHSPYSKEEVLICGASNGIGRQEKLPGQRMGVTEEKGCCELDGNHK